MGGGGWGVAVSSIDLIVQAFGKHPTSLLGCTRSEPDRTHQEPHWILATIPTLVNFVNPHGYSPSRRCIPVRCYCCQNHPSDSRIHPSDSVLHLVTKVSPSVSRWTLVIQCRTRQSSPLQRGQWGRVWQISFSIHHSSIWKLVVSHKLLCVFVCVSVSIWIVL